MVKAILLLYHITAFCISLLLFLIIMFFGYYGLMLKYPYVICAEIYIHTSFVDIMLDFVIVFICFYNLLHSESWDNKHFLNAPVSPQFVYNLFIIMITVSLLSIILNILSIYYMHNFKNMVKLFNYNDEGEESKMDKKKKKMDKKKWIKKKKIDKKKWIKKK
ncbi:conserved protein, unknown function, partial [Hepatocystis sp. ex Piliocolobus tephrosceles]